MRKCFTLHGRIFAGAVPDNFDERIEQKIFHAEIVVDNTAIARETKAYEKIPEVVSFTDAGINDTMLAEIGQNNTQIKADVKQVVADELKNRDIKEIQILLI